ncbi:MFS transporter [Neobacillus novalis]|uniref:MFS transporter n=1 Tax=Neobacillus novalis TaxID=220687 RepID=A0AA95MVS4_9BACI|nr:MFS transporter [Neobacillus novalis]WHY88598.1 MFS transporter [Neobacillus novalis]
MKKLAWIACLIYLLNGFGHIIIGSVLEPMVHAYQVDYSAGGQLIMNQFLGFLVGVLIAPVIVNSLGRRMTIFVALFCFALSQFVLSFLPDWNVLLITTPIGGAGLGIAETVVAALIIGSFKEKKAAVLVLAEVFFGVGALVIPTVSAIFIMNGIWNLSFTFVAVIITVTMFLWLFLSFGDADSFLKKQPRAALQDIKSPERKRYPRKGIPVIAIGALFFFFYVGTEMTFPNYLPTILRKTTDLGESALAISITVFWGAMTIGRLSMAVIIDKIGYRSLLIICCIGQFGSISGFALSTSATMSFISIFFAGLLMGGIFSIGLLLVNEEAQGLEENTTSILVALGGLGGAFLPKVAGVFIDRFPIAVTLWGLVVCSLVLLILMNMIFYFKKRAKNHSLVHSS